MSLPVDIHVDALDEFEEAVAWYQDRRPGLGFEFTAEIERIVASISERRGAAAHRHHGDRPSEQAPWLLEWSGQTFSSSSPN